MTERPYVLLSAAMSVDGCLDDASDERLVLSGPADLDRVDEVRAGCDAIMVGATTVRRDDPRLVVRSAARRAARVASGRPEQPTKVTVTATGDLPRTCRFFTVGDAARLVYAPTDVAPRLAATLGGAGTVVPAGDRVSLPAMLTDLAARGVRRLMVEGGGSTHTQFLTAGLADELQLVVAPLFVGDAAAPRFAGPGRYPWTAARRMRLVQVRQLDDVVLLRYLPPDRVDVRS